MVKKKRVKRHEKCRQRWEEGEGKGKEVKMRSRRGEGDGSREEGTGEKERGCAPCGSVTGWE